MKMIAVVALALVALAAAAPVEQQPEVSIVRSQFEQQPEGGYVFGYESSDGNRREETGEVKQVLDEENKPQNVVVVRGSFSYTDPEGNPQSVTYYADETGFHAEGDAIPKPSRR